MKQYYISLPDNEDAFYAFINLVINNKHNARIPKEVTARPSKIGWVKVSYTRNEMNEPFIIVGELKERVFVEMMIDQFHLFHSHYNIIKSLIIYENSDRYLMLANIRSNGGTGRRGRVIVSLEDV